MYVFTFPFLISIPQSQLEAECKKNSPLQGHRWLSCPVDIQPKTGDFVIAQPGVQGAVHEDLYHFASPYW